MIVAQEAQRLHTWNIREANSAFVTLGHFLLAWYSSKRGKEKKNKNDYNGRLAYQECSTPEYSLRNKFGKHIIK